MALSISGQSFAFLWAQFYLKYNNVVPSSSWYQVYTKKFIGLKSTKVNSKVVKVFQIIILNIKRYIMLKLQIFYIIKILIALFVLIKNTIAYKWRMRKVKIERIGKIPVKLFLNNIKYKEWKVRFDQKYRTKIYIRAFFTNNKLEILYHFFFLRLIYILCLILLDLPKIIKIFHKYQKEKFRELTFSDMLNSVKKPSKIVKDHQHTNKYYDAFKDYIQLKKTSWIKTETTKRQSMKYKSYKHERYHNISTQNQLILGFVHLQKAPVLVKASTLKFDFDTTYFINMLKLLLIKLQYKQGVFYKTTTEVWKQYVRFLFFDGINMKNLLSQILYVLRSIFRYTVIPIRSLVQNRFIHLSFRWNLWGRFEKILDQYFYTSFVYHDFNYNLNHLWFFLFYLKPSTYMVKKSFKKPDLWSRFILRNSNLTFIKVFTQNIDFLFNQEQDKYLDRYSNMKFASQDEIYKHVWSLLEEEPVLQTPIVKDTRKAHYKHVYGWHVLYDYFILSTEKAKKFYYYADLQSTHYLRFITTSLINKVAYRSVGSKFVNIYYRALNISKWNAYNILNLIHTNKFEKNKMFYTYKFVNKLKLKVLTQAFDLQFLNISKSRLMGDFFAIKRQMVVNKFQITLFELIYILVTSFIWYMKCMYYLYEPLNIQINWLKWNLLYKLNKKLHIQYIFMPKLIKIAFTKFFKIQHILHAQPRVRLSWSSKISIYRAVFLFNKFIYVYILKFINNIVSDIKLYLLLLKK